MRPPDLSGRKRWAGEPANHSPSGAPTRDKEKEQEQVDGRPGGGFSRLRFVSHPSSPQPLPHPLSNRRTGLQRACFTFVWLRVRAHTRCPLCSQPIQSSNRALADLPSLLQKSPSPSVARNSKMLNM
uniref:Uncharacterized protein n=1 Tax=Oryza meridionalis TaxID=40149 RepID=A0A0E0DI17_9ORYZ